MASEIPVVKRNALTYIKYKDDHLSQIQEKTRKGIQSTGSVYTYTRGVLLPEVKRQLEKLVKNGEIIHVLDAGAGMGHALKDAESLDPLVRAHGLALNSPRKGLGIHPENWTRGHFETTLFPSRFHIIQCRYGMQHAVNYSVALENLLNSLRPGGMLFVHDGHFARNAIIGHLPEYEKRELLKTLEKQGFSYEHRRTDDYEDLDIFKRRKSGRIADLSEFYESNTVNMYPVRKESPKISPSEIKKRTPKLKA